MRLPAFRDPPPVAGSTGLLPNRSAHHIQTLLEASNESEIRPASPSGITRDVLDAVLNLLATPVLLVDRQLNIIYSNTAATELAADRFIISNSLGRLHAAEADISTLRDVVQASVRGGPTLAPLILEASASGSSSSSRSDALCVWVRPVDRLLQTSAPHWAQGLVALMLRPLRGAPSLATSVLRSRYDLTARQIDVVKGLATGATLDEVAIGLGVTLPTVRSHLAQCFAKTGTRRQPDLIALALSFSSPIFE